MSEGRSMRDEVLVSVVVASKNRPDALQRLVDSVRAQDHAAVEVVIVDDGSEPPLPAMGDEVRLRNDASVGACAARNAGIARATGKYVLLFDDDCVLEDPTILSRAVALAERHPNLGGLAFREMRPTPEGRAKHEIQPGVGDETTLCAKFFAGMCLLRRDAVEELGAFNQHFGYYYEEMEMSLRLLDAGYPIVYDPSLEVLHCEDARGRDHQRIQRLLLRNALFTIVLRYPWWFVAPAAAVHLRRHFRPSGGARGTWWALREAAARLGVLLRERRAVRYGTLRASRRLNVHGAPLRSGPDGRLRAA